MANILLVTYEISYDDEDSYMAIYDALNDAIKEGRAGPDYWSETTSFYVVQTNENSHQFANRIWTAAGMRANKDRLLVINMNGEGGAAKGLISDQTLFSLLPFVKKL